MAAIASLVRAKALRQVEPRTLGALDAAARAVPGRRNAFLGRKEGTAAPLYYLVAGSAAHSICTVRGAARVVELHGAGDLFGEEFLYSERQAYTTVELLPGAVALEIPGRAVRGALAHSPALLRALLENLARRHQRMLVHTQWLGGRLGIERLSAFLMHHAQEGPAPQAVRLPAPKTVIASFLYMSAASLSRAFAELARRGLLAVRGARVELFSPPALAEVCGGRSGACATCMRCARGARWPG